MTITAEGFNDPMVYVISIGALVILMGSRIGLLGIIMKATKKPAIYVAPRGLITILLFFAIPTSQLLPNFNPSILLIVILGSNLIMTYGLMKFKPEGEKTDEDKPESTDPDVLKSGESIALDVNISSEENTDVPDGIDNTPEGTGQEPDSNLPHTSV